MAKKYYSKFFIENLKNRADIVAIIKPYVALKKRGVNWMGCCPFHQDKTPSFSVNAKKNFYNCFGCGEGGDVYTFLMEIEGLSFPASVRRVEKSLG
jgi:DNA primase